MDHRASLAQRLRAGLGRCAGALRAGRPLRIALVNDVGFVGGAGTALRRQAQSFLLDGHEVGVVCAMEQPSIAPSSHGRDWSAGWLGLHALPAENGSAEALDESIAHAVAALRPDLVVTGNFHWTRWPVSTFAALVERDIPCIAYLHDMHWVSGRCAYAGTCRKYLEGCDASCPTPKEYPALAPDRISDAWRARREIFVEIGVPLAANSEWMANRAREGFGGRAKVDLIRLGVDTRRFAPIERMVARRVLGLDESTAMVLVGAIDMGERRKGGHILRDAIPLIRSWSGATIVAFGHNSEYVAHAHGLGYITDERVMPVVLSAAELFLNVSLEESFGQTLLEAAACGIPSVAIARGGVPEIARDGVNSVVVDSEDPRAVGEAVSALLRDAASRTALGAGGRDLALREFSLEVQAARWREYVAGFA